MKSADDIRQLFKNAELRIHPDADERMFADVLQARRHPLEDQPATPDSAWRKIMRSPLTKLAAAAVVVIAFLIGLSLWRTTGSGIALADVLARVEQVKAFRFKRSLQFWSEKVTGEDPNKPTIRGIRGTFLISQEYGWKLKIEPLDPNGGESTFEEYYILPQKNTTIAISHKEKKYTRKQQDDGWIERVQKANTDELDPRTFLKRILKTEYESLGKSTMDGIEVEGFRTTDPNCFGREENRQIDLKVWVDVKTRLPVRYDATWIENKKEYEHDVRYDFQWDVPVAAPEFEPVIPGGYASLVVKFPPHLTEENALQGLKVLVELLGKYPEKITRGDDTDTVLRLAEESETPAALRLKEEIKGLTDDEINNKLVDFLIPIRGVGRFYEWLQFDEKDPAYYGMTVTPKDADKVLMRWKVSDREYRVIFGDLHAQTVTAEALAQLERDLPK